MSTDFQIRGAEACTSFATCDVLDMDYFAQLMRRGAECGINALTLFVIPDSYYPETSPKKTWEFEIGLDWPSDRFPEYRNAHCPNADPATEYLPQLAALCHSLGIRVYLRTINNKHKWLFPGKDPWRAIRLKDDGTEAPTSACCWDIPAFMDYYYELLRDLLERYATGPNPVDGIILDQQKCFGAYVNAESRAKFRELMGHEMDDTNRPEILEYWSIRNAQRVCETVQFCKTVNPKLDVGVTLEAMRRVHFDNGDTGMKYDLFNHKTSGVDFIHHQILDLSEEDCLYIWDKLAQDGPLWIMLDPTAADAGWDKEYWGWKPRTPDAIRDDVQKVKRVRERLAVPGNLIGITEFPISRLPLDHPNLEASLRHIGQA